MSNDIGRYFLLLGLCAGVGYIGGKIVNTWEDWSTKRKDKKNEYRN